MGADEYREFAEHAGRHGLPHRNVERLLAELCAMFHGVNRAKGTRPMTAADFLKGGA